jgi:hypothetical protein
MPDPLEPLILDLLESLAARPRRRGIESSRAKFEVRLRDPDRAVPHLPRLGRRARGHEPHRRPLGVPRSRGLSHWADAMSGYQHQDFTVRLAPRNANAASWLANTQLRVRPHSASPLESPSLAAHIPRLPACNECRRRGSDNRSVQLRLDPLRDPISALWCLRLPLFDLSQVDREQRHCCRSCVERRLPMDGRRRVHRDVDQAELQLGHLVLQSLRFAGSRPERPEEDVCSGGSAWRRRQCPQSHPSHMGGVQG